MKKSLWTYTFGCKVNQFDTSAMELQVSADQNWRINDRASRPDAILINTCTVTESADRQARQLIRKVHREYPQAQIVVTGCYAESKPNDFDKLNLRTTVLPMKKQGDLTRELGLDATVKPKSIIELPTVIKRTRATLKMQDGCNAYCSFCILPYVRGRSRSYPLTQIIAMAQSYEKAGYQEVVLTGTHIGAYGRDLEIRSNLAQAIEEILKATKGIQIRVSSLEPTTLSEGIIRVFGENDRILPHFHIPMQSGSDSVLRRMNRKNKVKNYVDRVTRLASKRDKVGIGADVIVGFCEESDAEFEETVSVIRDLPLTYLHVFPFSGRPGTKASTMNDTVPTEVKKQRVQILRDLSRTKQEAFFRSLVGSDEKVLIEKRRNDQGRLLGYTGHYVPVSVDGDDRLMENRVEVRIDRIVKKLDQSLEAWGKVL